MERSTVSSRSMQKGLESILQDALDLLETDDGKSFEEKKAVVIQMLTDKKDALLVNKLMDTTITKKSAPQIREAFWSFGEAIELPNDTLLRRVSNADREGFFTVQHCYSLTPAILAQEAYQNMLWSEHTEQESLMLSIYIWPV